jgi:hypothetical protein
LFQQLQVLPRQELPDLCWRDSGSAGASRRAGIAFVDECGSRPQTSLLADLTLPVGNSGFTDDHAIPKVLFLATSTLTDRLALTCNLGPSSVTGKRNGERRTDVTFNYAVAFRLPY